MFKKKQTKLLFHFLKLTKDFFYCFVVRNNLISTPKLKITILGPTQITYFATIHFEHQTLPHKMNLQICVEFEVIVQDTVSSFFIPSSFFPHTQCCRTGARTVSQTFGGTLTARKSPRGIGPFSMYSLSSYYLHTLKMK